MTICPSEEVPNVEGKDNGSGVSVCELHRGQTVQVFDAPYWGFCGKVEGLLEDDGVVQVAIRGERTVLINRDVVIAIGEE